MAAQPSPAQVAGMRDDDEPTVRRLTCTQHGAYGSRNLMGRVWTHCPGCAEELSRQREAEELQQADRARAELHASLLRDSGVFGRFRAATFDTFVAKTLEQRKVLQACQDFAATATKDTGAGLFLIGPPGTGKSHMCAAIVRDYIERHLQPAGVTTTRELIRELRATWRREAEYREDEVIRKYGADLHILALDEAGATVGSDSEQVQLLDIIDLRYRLRRPTIVASNLPLPDLKIALGERAFDRLREGAKVLACTWPSHRGAA